MIDVLNCIADVWNRLGFSSAADMAVAGGWVTPAECYGFADDAAKRLARLSATFAVWDTSVAVTAGIAKYTLPAAHVSTVAAWLATGGGTMPASPLSIAFQPYTHFQTNLLNAGPVFYGGALWAFPIISGDDSPDADGLAQAYKSTDAGATWVRQDAAHSPSAPTSADRCSAAWFWDGTSHRVLVVIAHQIDGSDGNHWVDLQYFDMTTGLWGAPFGYVDFAIPPSDATASMQYSCDDLYVCVLSGGAIRVVFTQYCVSEDVDGYAGSVWFRDYASGSWGSPVELSNGLNVLGTLHISELWSATRDGDTLHVILTYGVKTDFHLSIDWIYRRIAADATLSVWAVFANNAGDGDFANIQRCSGLVSGGNLLIPATDGSRHPALMTGTPLGAPVFTFASLPAFGLNAGFTTMGRGRTTLSYLAVPSCIFAAGGATYMLFTFKDAGTGDYAVVGMAKNSGSGWTWTTVANIDATPTAPAPYSTASSDATDINALGFGVAPDGSVYMSFDTFTVFVALIVAPPLVVQRFLRPTSEAELFALDATWPLTSGAPTRISLDAGGDGTATLYGIPVADGTLAQIMQQVIPGTLASGASTIAMPSVLQDYFTDSIIRASRSKESDFRMPEVSDHLAQRMALYETVIKHLFGGEE